jgi:hypothetical protein
VSEIREDFDIEYLNLVNRWAQIVGNGLTEKDTEGRDLAPYLAGRGEYDLRESAVNFGVQMGNVDSRR